MKVNWVCDDLRDSIQDIGGLSVLYILDFEALLGIGMLFALSSPAQLRCLCSTQVAYPSSISKQTGIEKRRRGEKSK